MHSAEYAVARCLSVRLSHAGIVPEQLYHQTFSLSGRGKLSHSIVFPHQTVWQYSDGDPLTARVECRGGNEKLFSTNISLCIEIDTR